MKKFKPRPGFVVQAYRFALDPNAAQERALRSHCGAARASYNWAVGWVTASWWQRKAEETYGINLGRVLMEQARALPNYAAERTAYLTAALAAVQRARSDNPANPLHACNLARVHRLWASQAARRGR